MHERGKERESRNFAWCSQTSPRLSTHALAMTLRSRRSRRKTIMTQHMTRERPWSTSGTRRKRSTTHCAKASSFVLLAKIKTGARKSDVLDVGFTRSVLSRDVENLRWEYDNGNEQSALRFPCTHRHSIGIFPTYLLTLGLSFLERMLLLVLKLHCPRSRGRSIFDSLASYSRCCSTRFFFPTISDRSLPMLDTYVHS